MFWTPLNLSSIAIGENGVVGVAGTLYSILIFENFDGWNYYYILALEFPLLRGLLGLPGLRPPSEFCAITPFEELIDWARGRTFRPTLLALYVFYAAIKPSKSS